MPRVKRSVHARKKRRKVLVAGEGLLGAQEVLVPLREGAGRALAPLRLPRPQEQEADVPAALDHPHQRGRAAERALVQPVHGRAAQGGDPARPQGARRARGERSAGVRRDRAAGEVRARSPGLSRSARSSRSRPGSARAARLCTSTSAGGSRDDPAVARDRRRRAGVGRAAAAARRPALPRARRRRVVGRPARRSTRSSCATSCATQSVQTNEVQRSWVLLPCFLRAAELLGVDELDVVELGPSAGPEPRLGPLPLRVRRRRVGAGRRAAAAARSRGALARCRRRCSSVAPRVTRRVGIDRAPVDVTTDEGARLLECFVWAGQDERLERLDARDRRRAREPAASSCAATSRDELPRRARGSADARLPDGGRSRTSPTRRAPPCGDALERAPAPVAFVTAGRPRGGEHGWGMRIELYPGGEREFVGHADFHGAWLDYSL